jgi:predicted nuclease of restriction endonuclease-like (RecB) superfamily
MKRIRHSSPSLQLPTKKGSAGLLQDVREIILAAREQVARAINAGLVLLYWQIGQRIRKDILLEKRAAYGEQILSALGTQLTSEFGRGFSARNLASMVRCAEVFPDPKILQALTAKLSWTHLIQIIYLDDPLKRDFYAEMCRIEGWSTRALEKKIRSMLFERTALSRKPAKLAEMELKQLREQDRITPDLVFRDLREMEAFILELGVGFAFLARQKRMRIGHKDYYLDLLFFHRKLRRLVAVDLKLGEFEAADKGQMELYLSWLKKHEQGATEEDPLGIILCAGTDQEHVELLSMQKSGIHVASYLTAEVPKAELEQRLHEAVRLARLRLASMQETHSNSNALAQRPKQLRHDGTKKTKPRK